MKDKEKTDWSVILVIAMPLILFLILYYYLLAHQSGWI